MNKTSKFIAQLKKLWRREEGASLVYLALTMTVLIFFSAIALDGSNAYLQRRKMQTAADAAALAGARALAMSNSGGSPGGGSPGARAVVVGGSVNVESEINSFVEMNGADSAVGEWDYDFGGRGVNVTARQTFDTWLIKAIPYLPFVGTTPGDPNYNEFTVGAKGAAAWEPLSAGDKLFPAAIEGCDCIGVNQQVTLKKENTHRLCVGNSTRYWNPRHEYAIWLYKLDPEATGGSEAAVWHYKIVNGPGTMVEKSDGTATMDFQVKNYLGHGWNIHFNLSGKTTKKGPGSPKFSAYTVDANEWTYYTNVNGTLTGIPGGRYNGAVLRVYGHGPSFQMGMGANVMESQTLGGASWYDWQVVSQPTTGIRLRTPDIHGDLNIDLSYCEDTAEDNDEPVANECEFNWIDWDGDAATSSELVSNMSNLMNSGVWRIGDRVKVGPNVQNVNEITDQLSAYKDKPVTVLVYDDNDGNEADGYAVCGFASFTLTNYQLSQWPQLLHGSFLPNVIRSVETSPDAPDFGARDVKMMN